MDYESFSAYAERCKKIWQDFKDSFQDPGLKDFLKHSYPVLGYPRGQIALGNADFYTIATESPRFFVPSKISTSLIERVRKLEALKRESEERNKKERDKIEAWLKEFDPSRLKLEESRLEVRFPSLKMELIQQVKKSPFVDQGRTGKDRESIRVVLSL